MAKTDTQVFHQVEGTKLERAAYIMRAGAHPLRIKMLGLIDKQKNINVSKIYISLNIEQSMTSQHLKILRQAELVKTRREGKYIFYSVNYDLIEKINALIEKYKMK